MNVFDGFFEKEKPESKVAEQVEPNPDAKIKNAGKNDKTASMDQLNIDDLNDFMPDPLPTLTEPLEALVLPDPRQHPEVDPRGEDMPEDSEAWSRLLVLANRRDPDLQMALYTMRACGTRLKWLWDKRKKHNIWKLVPQIGDHAWESEAEFRETAERYMGTKRADGEDKRGEVAKLLEQLAGQVQG